MKEMCRRWKGRREKGWEGRVERGEREDERKGRKERTKLITAGMCPYSSPKHKNKKTTKQNKTKQKLQAIE